MSAESFTSKAKDDLSFLGPILLNPLRELKRISFAKHRSLIGLAAIGMAPLAIVNFLDGIQAYWALAIYFSLFWLACFLVFFRGDSEIDPKTVALCYFGTMIVLAIYLPLTLFPPMSFAVQLLQSDIFLPLKSALTTLCIGIPEETCKTVILFVLWRTGVITTPRTMLLYGLISGLGFGFREGIQYQTQTNVLIARGDVASYYLLNMIRLTTCPFLHAIWTGIAGYFIGFARLYPERRLGFIIVAIGLPAVLHGVYDASAGSSAILQFFSGLLSVGILGIYLNSAEEFRDKLGPQSAATPIMKN